jgi:hypothetical protein
MRLLALVILVGGTLAISAAPAAAALPRGFVGVDADGPLVASDSPLDLSTQMGTMVASGVESVRVAFNWAAAQPYSSWSKVPDDQRGNFTLSEPRPTDFSATDEVVAAAAAHGLTVLPTILYAPRWDARHNGTNFSVPRRPAPYAQYASELVGRYGPHGSFWAENPQLRRLPIRMWQIWNEPNLPVYWPQPFARTYVPLLVAAHKAIKHADPGAKVVLGALTNVAWRGIAQIDKLTASRRAYEIAAVNGFTATPAKVITYLKLVRRAMRSHHARTKPLLATELSWPSSKGRSFQHADFDTTEAGQARNVAGLLPRLGRWRRRLRLSGFYYYTWIGPEFSGAPEFNFAGLLKLRGDQVTSKPALGAFRRAALSLEHCRAKGSTAHVCLH